MSASNLLPSSQSQPLIFYLYIFYGRKFSLLRVASARANAATLYSRLGGDLALRYDDAFRGQLKESAMVGDGLYRRNIVYPDTETIRHGNDNENYFPPSITEIA